MRTVPPKLPTMGKTPAEELMITVENHESDDSGKQEECFDVEPGEAPADCPDPPEQRFPPGDLIRCSDF